MIFNKNTNNTLSKIINMLAEMRNDVKNLDEKLNLHIKNSKEETTECVCDIDDKSKQIENIAKEKQVCLLQIKELKDKVNTLETTKELLLEEVDKLNKEIVNLDLEYESKNNTLITENNKLKDTISSYKTKYSEDIMIEYNQLKNIRDAICSHEKGASFWNSVADMVVPCSRKNVVNARTNKQSKESNKSQNIKSNNKSNNSYDLEIAGIIKTRKEWSEEWGLTKDCLRYRIKNKWDNLEMLFGRNFTYEQAKSFYVKHPEAVLYDTLDKLIKTKLTTELNIETK